MAKAKETTAAAAAAPVAQPVEVVKVAPQALESQQTGGELVAQSLDEMLLADAGAGLQGLGANDFAIPFIAILQKGSPQVSRANSKYIVLPSGKGAESGMIMNTVTQEVVDGETGILFVPCGYNKSVVEWKPRDSGGGLVAHHSEHDPFLKTCTQNERGQLIAPETGNVLIDTAYHFGLILHEDGVPEWAVLSMYSSQLKKSRMWNTTMRRIMFSGPNGLFNPPTYSHIYKLTTVGETKDSYDWFGWKIEMGDRVSDMDTFRMAREFSKQITSGNVRISVPPQDFDTVSGDVPF